MNTTLQLLSMIGVFALLFVASLSLSWIIHRLFRRRVLVVPHQHATMRLRATSGMYRAKFLAESTEGWVLSAPLQRDRYVPIRQGEHVTVEVPSEGGVMLFRSEVLSRSMDDKSITIRKPIEAKTNDRREEPRTSKVSGVKIAVEGKEARLANLSTLGAAFSMHHNADSGERIRIDLPWEAEPVFAWILETSRASEALGEGLFVRVRFEEPRTLPAGV